MEARLLAVVFLFLVISKSSEALRCFVCSHSKSWSYCARYGSTVSCPSAPSKVPTCYSLMKHKDHLNNTRDYYFSKGCIYQDHCTMSYMCTSKDNCQLRCCAKDLCNGSPRTIELGKALLVLSLIVSLFHMNVFLR